VTWVLRIGVAYVLFILCAIGVIQYLARTEHDLKFDVPSPDRQYRLVAYRDVPLPLWLGGSGASPGEIEVLDAQGRTIDGERLDDVVNVTQVAWERYTVAVYYRRGTQTYRAILNLRQ
jgi:hypothetical protein